MRMKEMEDTMGALTMNVIGMEYSDDVYAGPSVTELSTYGNITMPTIKPIGPIIPLKYFNASNNANLTLDPGVYGNIIPNQVMRVFGSGTQIEDQGIANTNITSGTTFQNIMPNQRVDNFDLTDVDPGDFTYNAFADHGGTNLSAGYDIGFRSNGNITFANATTTQTFNIGSDSIENIGFEVPTTLIGTFAQFSTNPEDASYGNAMVGGGYKATQANIFLEGYSDAQTSVSAPRAFDNMSYQIKRITKGEK